MSVANFLNAIKLFAQILPIIRDLISHYEVAFPGTGNGTKRLEAVKATIQQMVETIGVGQTVFAPLWALVSAEVERIVAFNKPKANIPPSLKAGE